LNISFYPSLKLVSDWYSKEIVYYRKRDINQFQLLFLGGFSPLKLEPHKRINYSSVPLKLLNIFSCFTFIIQFVEPHQPGQL